MSKTNLPDEIQVLRFFETGPIEKVEVVFNIVSDKMRERLKDRQPAEADRLTEKTSALKRRPATGQVPALDQRDQSEPAV
jgi:hypothetical protein